MFRFVHLFIILLLSSSLSGQNYSSLEKVRLKGPSDYALQDSKVLECVNYILQSPLKENESNKAYAQQFVLRWMEGTPDYNFIIGPDFMELTNGKADLSGIYISSLVKATLQNNSETHFLDEINTQAKDIYLDYCGDPNNKVKNTKSVKKMLKERDKEK